MDDGETLQGEFDSENKVSFYSFSGKSCVKFEVECPDKQENTIISGAEKLLKELAE
jgi:type VI secretion system secreted protein VgrG